MNTSSLAPSTHYQDDKGKAYVASRQSDPDSLGHALNFEFFRPYLKPTDVVLDFGCGNGGLLKHLARRTARAEGLEINPEAARMARSNGHTVYSRLEEIPTTTRYDVIVTNHVLEHLRERLKPGGQLVAKLPLDDWREPRHRLVSVGHRLSSAHLDAPAVRQHAVRGGLRGARGQSHLLRLASPAVSADETGVGGPRVLGLGGDQSPPPTARRRRAQTLTQQTLTHQNP